MTASEWEAWSLVCVYTALVIYTLAFIVYALDFASRAAAPVLRKGNSAIRDTTVAGDGRTVLARVSQRAETAAESTYRPGATVRVATALTVLAVLVQTAGVVIRGFTAGRVPFANLYEFTTLGTLLFGVVYLVVLTRRDIRYVGVFVTGLLVALLGISTISFYVPITPLPPALQSPWLVIHIIVASLGWGLLALGCALSILQLLRARADHAKPGRFTRMMATFPHSDALELLAYRVNIVGFIFWTFTLIAGAIWANDAWGRYWGWDTKEVWTFIIWVIYACYIHARATRGWRGTRSAWLSIIGFAAVIFNTTIVNVFFKGLHAYSGI